MLLVVLEDKVISSYNELIHGDWWLTKCESRKIRGNFSLECFCCRFYLFHMIWNVLLLASPILKVTIIIWNQEDKFCLYFFFLRVLQLPIKLKVHPQCCQKRNWPIWRALPKGRVERQRGNLIHQQEVSLHTNTWIFVLSFFYLPVESIAIQNLTSAWHIWEDGIWTRKFIGKEHHCRSDRPL